MLFSYHGTTHFVYFYLDLSEKIQQVFQESGKKMGFNYDLSDKDRLPLWEDIRSMPKEKETLNDYDLFCKVNLVKMSPHNRYNTKISFELILEIYDVKSSTLLKTTSIHVKCYRFITTQNKKLSSLIYEALRH